MQSELHLTAQRPRPLAVDGAGGGTAVEQRWNTRRHASVANPVGLSVPFSVLDLCPVPTGVPTGEALRRSVDLARHV
jgi:hypothetical protein